VSTIGSSDVVSAGGSGDDRGVAEVVRAVGDAYLVTVSTGQRLLTCARCAHVFGPITEDPKLSAAVAERPITSSSELNAHGLVDELVLREFYCPGCGALIAANVQRVGDPVLVEMRLV
jgi:acetone carboxylase gamma subunit